MKFTSKTNGHLSQHNSKSTSLDKTQVHLNKQNIKNKQNTQDITFVKQKNKIAKTISQPVFFQIQNKKQRVKKILNLFPSNFISNRSSQQSKYTTQILQEMILNWDKHHFEQNLDLFVLNNTRIKSIVQMYQICVKFNLKRQTFYLAVYIYDKYYQKIQRNKKKGKNKNKNKNVKPIEDASLLIAMKYQQIYPPLLKKWCKSPAQAIQKEQQILSLLGFQLVYTSCYYFFHMVKLSIQNRQKITFQHHERVLDLYLFTGQIYSRHPLQIVTMIFQAFKRTYRSQIKCSQNQEKIIIQHVHDNQTIWQYLCSNPYKIKN